MSNTTNSLVSDNTVDHNTDYGIYLVEGSTADTIVGNRVFANAQQFQRAASGIRLYGSPGNVVSSNVIHDNEASAIEIYTGSNNNLVVNNVTYNNGDHGIDNFSSTGGRIISTNAARTVPVPAPTAIEPAEAAAAIEAVGTSEVDARTQPA